MQVSIVSNWFVLQISLNASTFYIHSFEVRTRTNRNSHNIDEMAFVNAVETSTCNKFGCSMLGGGDIKILLQFSEYDVTMVTNIQTKRLLGPVGLSVLILVNIRAADVFTEGTLSSRFHLVTTGSNSQWPLERHVFLSLTTELNHPFSNDMVELEQDLKFSLRCS